MEVGAGRVRDAMPLLGTGIVLAGVIAPGITYFEYRDYWFNLTVPGIILAVVIWHITRDACVFSRKVWCIKQGSFVFLFAALLFIIVLETITAIANGRDALQVISGSISVNGLWMQRVLVAPAIEELVFRYLLLDALVGKTDRIHRSNFLVSALFTAVHFPGWVDDPSKSASHVVAAFLFSLVLGYLYINRGKVSETIACHSLVNHLG